MRAPVWHMYNNVSASSGEHWSNYGIQIVKSAYKRGKKKTEGKQLLIKLIAVFQSHLILVMLDDLILVSMLIDEATLSSGLVTATESGSAAGPSTSDKCMQIILWQHQFWLNIIFCLYHSSIILTTIPLKGCGGARANPSCHWTKGRLQPGQVTSVSHWWHRETNNLSASHSQLWAI